MLIVLSIFWGGSFFFVEIALQDFSALTIVALRVSIATILLWTIVFYTKLHVPISLKLWLSFLIMGILNNAIPFSLIPGVRLRLMRALHLSLIQLCPSLL